jgi:hypothetical protein
MTLILIIDVVSAAMLLCLLLATMRLPYRLSRVRAGGDKQEPTHAHARRPSVAASPRGVPLPAVRASPWEVATHPRVRGAPGSADP